MLTAFSWQVTTWLTIDESILFRCCKCLSSCPSLPNLYDDSCYFATEFIVTRQYSYTLEN